MMTMADKVREDIDNSEFCDLEFLVKDASGDPVGHVYAPFKRRNWALFQLSKYVGKDCTVDRRTRAGWETNIDWRKLAH